MDALEKASEISFAAGAEKVFLPYNEVVTITKRGAYQPIRDRGVRVNDPLFLSYQPQGTLRMGVDRKKSVVDPHGDITVSPRHRDFESGALRRVAEDVAQYGVQRGGQLRPRDRHRDA